MLEKNVKHPLAELLYKEAIQRGCDVIASSDFSVVASSKESFKNGLAAKVLQAKGSSDSIDVCIGNIALMAEKNVEIEESIHEDITRIQSKGSTVILVAGNN